MPEWFENESLWRETYPFTFSEQRFAMAEEEVSKIIALVGFHGGVVLDLCCGPGRHAVALAKRGCSVTGVDRSKFLLQKAEERAKAEGVRVEFIQEDMRNFSRVTAYDLALNVFTSFGYFNDREDDIKVLRNIHASLKPAGVCLFEMMSKEWLARHLFATSSLEAPDGTLRVERHEIFDPSTRATASGSTLRLRSGQASSPPRAKSKGGRGPLLRVVLSKRSEAKGDDWSRIRNEWTFIKEGRAKTFKFHHTIYSGQELKDRLYQVGFKRVKLFGDLDGNEYGTKAQRLVAAAWKG